MSVAWVARFLGIFWCAATVVTKVLQDYTKTAKSRRKSPRGGELTAEEKAENRRISRDRILIENINAKVKVFKITANKYRNRRRRFNLRMSLICGILNFELG
jgi:hypothetical protein